MDCVSPILDVVTRLWDCTANRAVYMRELQDNLIALKRLKDELEDLRKDVENKADLAEQQPYSARTNQVKGWLERVQLLLKEVDDILQKGDAEIQQKCLGSCCPRHCRTTYKLGKQVVKMIGVVKELESKGHFDVFTDKLPQPMIDEMPMEKTVGMETMFDEVWKCVEDHRVGIIGLYGMGGAGKTTLLKKLNNKFLDTSHNFDVVIWVVVSKDVKLENIQETIGKKIGLSGDSWKSKRVEEKALDIFNILTKKRFVLLVDDIWKHVDLINDVGVPSPSPSNSSKIVFTTRFNEVCGHMEADREFQVKCLTDEEAWNLFQMKVGRETLENHPGILQVAKRVAKECGGLPLALITIGRAMARKKTIQEWNQAIRKLEESAYNFEGMEEKVYSLLKFSYDSLASDTCRSCLLYCCLFPEDYEIENKDLIDYWIGEGFIDEYVDGYSIIGDLLRACLLEEVENELNDYDCVKIHDVIRDMSLWIACKFEKEKEMFFVQAGVGLTEAPEIEKWEGVKRMSLMGNQIKNLSEIPSCPRLLTLFLNKNDLEMINNDFFQFMSCLKVLNLSSNYNMSSLEFSRLVFLQHLDLSHCKIHVLPEELKALTNLRCLKLSRMMFSKSPRRLLPCFPELRVFRISNPLLLDREPEGHSVLSEGGEELVEELLCLKHLIALSIQLKGSCPLQKFLKSQKLQSCTQLLHLSNLEESFAVLSLTGMTNLDELIISNSNLKELKISDSELEELKIDYCPGEIQQIPESHCFHSLVAVSIFSCENLRDVTWLVFAPNLKVILMQWCGNMEEIISVEKCGQVIDGIESLNPFSKLQYFATVYLSQLKSIYWKPLPFPHLKRIDTRGCPKLEKLPLDFNSVKDRKIDILADASLLKELKREYPALNMHFLPTGIVEVRI